MRKAVAIILLFLSLVGFTGAAISYAGATSETAVDLNAGDNPSPYPPYHRNDK